MAQNKDSLLTRLNKIMASPVTVGLALTAVLAGGVKYYLDQREQLGQQQKGFLRFMYDIDRKFVDYRMILRGPKAPHPDVAVLAIDDASIEQVGRWPWPRETLARALDAAYEHGAKVIAADVVWSEPTDRPEVRLLQRLGEQVTLQPQVVDQMNRLVEEYDSDRLFSKFIERNKERFVLGNFFEDAEQWFQRKDVPGISNLCIDLAFDNHVFKNVFERLERQPIVLDEYSVDFPPALADAYRGYFDEFESAVREQLPPPTSEKQARENAKEVQARKVAFCKYAFLKPSEDADQLAHGIRQQWDEAKNMIFASGNAPSSFDEWVNNLKSTALISAIPETYQWTLNIPKIFEPGIYHGYFNAFIDSDGVLRKSQLISSTGTRKMASIGLWGYLIGTDTSLQIQMGTHPRVKSLKVIEKMSILNNEGDHLFDIPTDFQGFLWINYRGPGHSIPHASIADLLDENKSTVTVKKYAEVDGAWRTTTEQVDKSKFFKNKILVLGATAIGVYDLRNTTFDPIFPGVETHANVIDNLLRRDFLYNDAREERYMPIVMVALGILLSILLAHAGALPGLLWTLAIGIVIAVVDKHFLFGRGIVVSSGFALLQTGFTYVTLTFYKYLTEERSKKELRQTFSKYVSPSIVEEVLKDPKNLELGGRKEKITVFFSDVRGFTTISEKLDPRDLSDLLNSYLTPMTDLVFQNKGTLDKYMGDAIMAFFGAPLPMKDHAKWACRCALQHLQKLEELKAEYKKKGLPEIDIGIGLNTGECSVGNMGSQTVRNYTVMGDTVNLASRLEGINKQYGTRIIISEFTYAEVKDVFTCREIDRVRVKGKNLPVKIFELISEGKPPQHLESGLEFFRAGYALYHEKKFAEALTQFQQASLANPQDMAAKLYIERCQELLAEPPGQEWDGVFVMKTK